MLNVCDFQKNTFVHVVDDDIATHAIGEVKELDDGKLIVEIEGQQKMLDFENGLKTV